MRLLLSGGGDPRKVRHLDQFFADNIDKRKTVLYVPSAWEGDPTYAGCLEWFKATYGFYGISRIVMFADLNDAPNIMRYGGVFIGGGNTFKLLKEIRESGFDVKLIAYMRSGGFVYGGSAGSIIFGKDIAGTTYDDENKVGLQDTRGLNMAKGFHVYCHYMNRGPADTALKLERLREHSGPSDMTIALPEDCGAYIEDDVITFMGSGAALLTERGE